ncbi:type III pantothenate kinase [Allopusillimonas soli]|uniref:Type III pantothenate kinase n=1 Tax=Allopusillimonas soli TaxID=659016 RepID=A0A853FDS9_9BURK|nr:type III pantothenate kinase [Allopusillimonas soli]NYT38049.1 type III pantothenate kinase [Allopusillimonas soli]TEA74089.1 type III pantothenate kinase [Allopusillimonas soli]
MIILIDAGNTRIKCGWVAPVTGEREQEAMAVGHADLNQLEAWLSGLAGSGAKVQSALGTNVAGERMATRLAALVQRCCAVGISWVAGTPEAQGVHNSYLDPAQLGPDRWVSMVGLSRHMPVHDSPPLMLAGFGTTTTIDTLAREDDGKLVFSGGLILPGPQLMASSLNGGTAMLPLADSSAALFPRHTHEAIGSGIAAAQTGALLRQWREGLERYGRAPRVYSSGGGWPMMAAEAQRTLARMQDDLGLPRQGIQWLATPVLDGLACLASARAT